MWLPSTSQGIIGNGIELIQSVTAHAVRESTLFSCSLVCISYDSIIIWEPVLLGRMANAEP